MIEYYLPAASTYASDIDNMIWLILILVGFWFVLCQALKDERAVTSPTFTLIHEYPGKLTLCHLDAYRLENAGELLALGFYELQREDSAVIVEWADRVPGAMPDEMMWIDIASTGDTDRALTVRAFGETAVACLKAWQAAVR